MWVALSLSRCPAHLGVKMENLFPSLFYQGCSRYFRSDLCLIFMLLVMEQAIPSNEEREITFFFRLENSAIKIFSNEKFYGYDDGFGIRIKQRFSAIIRRHSWQSIITRALYSRANIAQRVISLRLFFLSPQCKHGWSEIFSVKALMLTRWRNVENAELSTASSNSDEFY